MIFFHKVVSYRFLYIFTNHNIPLFRLVSTDKKIIIVAIVVILVASIMHSRTMILKQLMSHTTTTKVRSPKAK